MERQQVIGRAYVVAVIDRIPFERCIGSPAIMAEQCGRVAKLAEDGLITLNVVPEGANIGTGGAFDIATKGAVSTVCLTTSSRDITSTAPAVIDENVRLFDAVLGMALAPVPSLAAVREYETRWKGQI
jgi:hypothetical protein